MSEDIQTSAIMSAGMRVLRETLGVIEAEIFISNISSNKSDYTKWRENLWEDLTLHELLERAEKAEKNMVYQKGLRLYNKYFRPRHPKPCHLHLTKPNR